MFLQYHDMALSCHVKICSLSHNPLAYKYVGRLASNLTWGGMGKYQKQLHNFSQRFTNVRVLKVTNMYLVFGNTSHCKQKRLLKKHGMAGNVKLKKVIPFTLTFRELNSLVFFIDFFIVGQTDCALISANNYLIKKERFITN